MATARPEPPQPVPDGDGASRRTTWLLFLLFLAPVAALWLWQGDGESAAEQVEYSRFYGWAEAGKVSEVHITGQNLKGELTAAESVEGESIKEFETTIPASDDTLMPMLHEQDIEIAVSSDEQGWGAQVFVALLPWVLIIGLWVWLSQRARRMMGGESPLAGMMKSKSHRFDKSESVSTTFDDVAGLKAAKQDLQEVVQFLVEPERFQKMGGRVPRGVLLVGPPGTGKTLLARAVAGESGVPFYRISASEFIELFVGVGAARVRDLFAEAKKHAPSIVFIDEIDAVGRSRGAGLGGGHDEREQTLNQLLSEMDGFDRNDLTIVLAATNRPDVLDPALLRPGRFDRRVIVDRPELAARCAILAVHTKGKPLAEDVSLDDIAEDTPGFSGADLSNLVNEAALTATRRGGDSISREDFNHAFDKIVLGDPRETRLSGPERRRVAVHEAGHAVVARFSKHAETLRRVSIIPRGMSLGATQQTPAGDRHLMTQPQLESRLRVLMGGRAAELLIFGDVSTGAESDLKQATEQAMKMMAHYGMSDSLGPMYLDHGRDQPFLGQAMAMESGVSDATTSAIETESRELLKQAFRDATALLTRHRDQLESLIAALLEHESLEAESLDDILGRADRSVEGEDAA